MSLLARFEKAYGDFRLSVDLNIREGVTGLLGASGSGKSLTLKCIAGIEKPDRGRIELDGAVLFDSEKHIDLPPQKRQVGYLFQSYALFPNMTAKQNILCGLHSVKDRRVRERLYDETVRLLGIETLGRHHPHQLSGGQQQRVALARILVNRPKLLLLDEPFSALDHHLRDSLCTELKRILNEYGGPSILVTHDCEEAYRLCESVAAVDSGTVRAPRETEALFARPQTVAEAVMTGCKNILSAQFCDAHHAFVPQLNRTLEIKEPIDPSLCAIGIRADAFRFSEPANELNGRVQECFRLPDRQMFLLLPDGGRAVLTCEIPADATSKTDAPVRLGISPERILPLYAAAKQE